MSSTPRHRRAANADESDKPQITLLITSVATLHERVDNLIDAFERHRTQATSEHLAQRQVVDAMAGSVRALTDTISRIGPLVEDYRTKRDEARGMARLARVLQVGSYGLTAAAGAFAHKIWP